jgi:hypothetical protein
MQRWELNRVWVPLETKVDEQRESDWVYTWREHGEKAGKALERADQLAAEGWELVAVMPQLRSDHYMSSMGGGGSSCERGYLMFFKRPLVEA